MKVLLLFQRVFSVLLLILNVNAVHSQQDKKATIDFLISDQKVKNFELNDKLGTPNFIYFSDKASFKTSEAVEVIRNYFDLQGNDYLMTSLGKTELPSGISVEKIKQFFKGIPIEQSSYHVVSKNDIIVSITAESYALASDFSVLPSLSKDAAREKALQFVNARKYAWQSLEEDINRINDNPSLRQKLESLRLELYPAGELVIAKDVYGNGLAKLAWKFNVYATEPLGRYNIYIDAMNGKLLLRDMIIKHAGEEPAEKQIDTIQKIISLQQPPLVIRSTNIDNGFQLTASESGQAHTRYAGVRDIYTTRVSVPVGGTPDPNNNNALLSYSGVDPRSPIVLAEQVFILKDDTRGGGVETYDMNGAGGAPVSLPALHATSLAFVDRNVLAGSQNIWKNETAAGTNEDHVRGATSNGSVGSDEAVNDDLALDAHWGAEIVYDYWKNVHNRFSFDNKNSAIKSYVHYGPAYDNAFWNGSVMTYGDGSGTTAAGFKPLTSLDVCAHEIGHGVCSFTSDLVYESESGAMNEALSDIWAASIERYVLVNIDPSLISAYKPWSIGEQISANPAVPLRRMDNPKARTDPDTYGGQYWVNPVCTPTLANDQCGVHTNSGVLNKYYYLLCVGSLAGSGPDASYAVPGADDGMRDNGAIYNSIPYSVTGIGFNKAEAITYLMEILLTPNATFAQARTAAINAARILYGECSAEEISVTNAWNAIGVGPAYTTCGLPVISASALVTDVRETAGGLDCIRYNEYNVNVNLTAAQPGPVTVNFNIGTTTMSPDEYALSASSVTYNTGETGFRTVKLRIYDDAMVESDETIDVTVTCAGPVLNQTFTFTVRNDDVNPNIGGTQTLINENFESFTEGGLGAPSSSTWGKIDKLTPANVQWAVRTDGPSPTPIVFTTKRAIIEITAPVAIPGEALYDQVSEANTVLRAPMVNATGLNSIKVAFKYQAGGEPACDPACDYAQLLYSFDGVNFSSFVGLEPLYLTFNEAEFEYMLPSSFNGKQFYLGIQWYDDANAGTSGSVAIDSFVVTGKGKAIESELNDAISEKVNAETGKPTYFYSTADGEIMARISNNTAHNYGCISANVEKAGSSAFQLYSDGTNSHRVGDKIIRMTPVTNNPTGSYNITLYFTEQEIQAIEAFTSLTRTNFYIYKTAANPYTGATSANTERVAAAYTVLPGIGGSFSATFASGFSAFALGASVSIALPVNCVDFKAIQDNGTIKLQWQVDNEQGNSGFEIERSSDGINFAGIGRVNAQAGGSGNYTFSDISLTGTGDVYYRLKQTDFNGASRYICTILKVSIGKGQDFVIGRIHPNPAADESFVNVFTGKAMKIQLVFINASGQLVARQSQQLQPGTTRIALGLSKTASGTYLVQFRNEKGDLLGVQTYVRVQ